MSIVVWYIIAVGTEIGSAIPVAENAVGAGVGLLLGVGVYAVTDTISFNGKTLRTWVKEGVNNLW